MQIFLNLLQIEFKLRLLAYKLGKLKKKVIIKKTSIAKSTKTTQSSFKKIY